MEQTSVTQESKGFYKLNWLQRIGFGSGDLAQNLIYQTICMYLLFFYTDIYGLNPGVAATMFLVVRLVDVLWDPLVGTYVDKHNPRWGKYRSYLVLAGLPLTVLAILCFWNGMEGQTETIKLIYAYVTYVGLSMLYTLINVPYGALNSSLTRDTDEITILTSVRMFMANVGGLCVSAGVPILVAMPQQPRISLSRWHSSWVWALCHLSSLCHWFLPSRKRWARRICSTSSLLWLSWVWRCFISSARWDL